MKTIWKVNTDNPNTIRELKKVIYTEENIIITSDVKVFIIKENGEVTEI